MNIFDRIPEEDRVCVNCDHFLGQTDGGESHKCHGEMPCLNFHKDNTENYFVPDNEYLEWKFGCEACDHYDPDEASDECCQCSRYYEDLWKRGGIS